MTVLPGRGGVAFALSLSLFNAHTSCSYSCGRSPQGHLKFLSLNRGTKPNAGKRPERAARSMWQEAQLKMNWPLELTLPLCASLFPSSNSLHSILCLLDKRKTLQKISM